ncbi:uncharacterized protein LOC111051982 [Nilaparvata lugens]|uniref:uncharacterized protein LOC111051982 n=1 Tax=Nilaparvata lugens TaxID=108931 RepID=UPI00193CF109|nr:uncharacterized protein LOC111051982 [Nilaparvata lugens]
MFTQDIFSSRTVSKSATMVFDKKLYILTLFVIMFVGLSQGVPAGGHHNTNFYCPDFQPQKSLDLEQLMGMWYGIEIVQHRHDGHNEGKKVLDTCPVLHFTRMRNDQLRLFWHEDVGTLEYFFSIPDPYNPGFWISSGPQNGTLIRKSYRQFAGTVQVMKAVGSHVVVTFCSPNSELFSVILSRHKQLDLIEIRGVKNMLTRRGLAIVGTREACRNHAFALTASNLLLMLMGVLALKGVVW